MGADMKKIVLSGLVYGQKPTGIYRFANEILLELDTICKHNEFDLIVPEYSKNVPEFKNINVVRYGKVKGLLWEQTSLLAYLYKNNAISLNFTNSMPILRPGIIVIHDVSYKMNPQFYSSTHGKAAMWWHRFNYWWASVVKSPVVTVTNYSKNCIEKYYKIQADKIEVIGNAWQHIKRVEEEECLEKYGLESHEYFFSLGSVSARKNTKWIYEVAKNNANYKFVISGSQAKNSANLDSEVPKNVLRTGYISDGEMKNLMRNCKAFIFPSKFEGFGIPPLEAMSLGASVISSNASCLPEIYEDQVTYIDPDLYEVDLERLDEHTETERILQKYSWEKSAEKLLKYLRSKSGEE